MPNQSNNQDSTANRNPLYHNFPNLQQDCGPSQIQIGTSGYLDSQLLNCDLQKLPCLPTVANRTSHLPSRTDKIVAENSCLQSNHCFNPITGVHSAGFPPITVPLMEQQHQNTVLNPAAPNFLPNQEDPQSNGIAAPVQFPQPVNSQHGIASTFPVKQCVTHPSQLCNNQIIHGSQAPSNFQAPVTSTIHAPMCINQPLNPVGQNQLSQPLINQSLLPTVNQHISSVYSNPNVTQEKGNVDFKHSIKLPPLKLQNFNGNPIHFHEWINNFNTMIHNNTSITDTHRITYLQNSVSGKAKDLIHAYSCDPSYYQTALNELIRHFGDRTLVVNAFLNQLENWQMNFQNKQSFIAFSSFLKRLVQAFQYLGFTADLQSTTLIKKVKEKTPHHLVLKWTEHCLTDLSSDPNLVDFQQWLELQAQIYDKVSRESNQRQRTISSQASKFVNSNNLQTKPNNSNLAVSVNNASADSRKRWHIAPQQKQPSTSQNVPNKVFNTKRSCEKCKQDHSIATCPEYQLCSSSDRYNLVSQNNLCTNCLSNKHHKQSCPSQKRCQVCSGFHHTTLHDPAKQIKRPTAAFSTEVFSGNNPTASSSSKASSQTPNTSSQQKSQTNKAPNSRYGQTFNNQCQQNVQRRNLNGNAINQSFSINQYSETPKNWYEQLQLLPVSFLKGNKAFDTYALIDPGSQFSFVLDAIAEFLELPRETQQSVPLQFLNTENSMSLSKIVEPVTITPYKSTETSFELSRTFSTPSLNVAAAKLFELNQICDAFNSLRHIHFPNIADGKTSAFTYPTHVIPGNQIQPFGVKTKVGRTLAGEYENCISATTQQPASQQKKKFIFHVSRNRTDEPGLDELVQQFWSIEADGIQKDREQVYTKQEEQFLDILKNSINHNGERYEFKLPWKSEIKLENNFYSALNQVKSLNTRLQRKPSLQEKYNKILLTDLEKNYVKPVEMQDPQPDRIWYLPHHPVENIKKPGKVRRAANAASKFRGQSLNSNLLTVPDLLNKLLGVLMRFREHPVAVLADIEGMFMQIAIHQLDQSALQFLWLADNQIQQYQFTRLIFGANCSPSCALHVLNHCAKEKSQQFPEALKTVRKHFYMDDYIQSYATEENACKAVLETKHCLQTGGFRLTKFVSNSSLVLNQIPPEDKDNQTDVVRVLGVKWTLEKDWFLLKTLANFPKDASAYTPRKIFSLVSSIFDPIGVMSPSTIRFKIVLQELWKLGKKWDEQIAPQVVKPLQKNLDLYFSSPDVTLNRTLNKSCHSPESENEIHIFVDASAVAVAAVAYLKTVPNLGTDVETCYLIGKCKVAPIKQISIPKLELEAAVIGVRLLSTIMKESSFHITRSTIWTDSQVVLDWLSTTKKQPAFVANRLKEILASTGAYQWKHVTTK